MPKNKTGFKLKASILALAMLGAPLAANAAGIGKLTVLSALGQPLRAEIDLSASKDEMSSLTAKLGTPEQFRQQGVEYSSALGAINLSVEKRSNGQAYVRMTSDRPVNEPFLDVLVELSWASGRLLREYTFLLDPPDLARKAPVSVAVPEARSSAMSSPVAAEKVAPPARIESAEKVEKVEKQSKAKQSKTAPVKVEETPAAEKPAAPAKTESQSGVTREVKRGDTLAKIAAESAHDGVSLDQMLVAIFSTNKEAFAGDNMNRLKTGRILSIPSKEEAASVSDGEARKAISVHSANFNAYRKKLAEAAVAAPAADAAASQSAGGKIAPKVEDKAPAAASGKDKLEISRTELGKDGKAGKSAEDKIAKERELKDAKTRIAELEKNVADLNKLNAVGSKSMAEAEKKAAGDKAANDKKLAAEKLAAEKMAADKVAADKLAADKAVAEKATADKAMADKAAADKASADKLAADKATADKAEADKLAADKAASDKAAADKDAADKAAAATAAAPAEGAAPVEAAAPADSAPPPPKKKVVLPPPEPEPEPSFIEDNPGIVFGGGALLAALAGFFGLREYRRRKGAAMEQPSQFGEPSAMSSVFGATGGESVDTRNVSIGDSISQSSMAGGDGAAGVDPVAEAEVYMAYGRDAQAEEILIEAMKNEPQRHAIHLKLLELYAARKSARPFETVAEDLLAQTGGNGAVWEKAVAMGRTLDPNNPLYSAGAAIATPAVAAPAPVDTGAFDNFGTSTVIMPPGQLAKMAAAESAPAVETVAMPALAEPVLAAAAPALDFDLDLGSGTEEAQTDAPMLDFDLDLGSDAPAAAPAMSEIGLDLDIQSISPEPVSAPSLDVEFDLDMPSTAAPMPESPPSVDFDFNLDTPADVAPTIVPEPISAPAMDFGAISLDLDDVPSATAPALEFESPPGSDENPEVATKIELAQAYEEMGDKEGMRELLQEVLAEGSQAQQDLARNKLAQHGL